MKKSLFCTLFVFLTALAFADEVKPLYRLPEKNPVNAQEGEAEHEVFLVGSDNGLFRVTNRNSAIPVWTEGRVDQLLRVTLPDASGVTRPAWLMRTQKGIFYSNDLKTFEERDKGLPFLTIKKYSEGTKNLELQIQELKDLCVNPLNNSEVVTATKDSVFFSRDGGLTWQNLSSMSKNSPGVKAVAVATIENQPVVFMAHPIFGLSFILPDKPKPEWQDIDAGFEKMPSLTSPDEIADILPVVRTNADGSNYTEIYISQTYIPRIYRLNWQEKQAELIYTGSEPTDVTDGLTTIDNVLLYTKLEGFGAIDLDSLQSPGTPSQEKDWHDAFSAVPGMINTAWIPQSRSGFARGLQLNELWLLYPGTVNTPYAEVAKIFILLPES